MLGFIIVFLVGIVSGYFSAQAWGTGWGITCGIAAFLLAYMILSLILRKFVMDRQMAIQNIMQDAQNKVNRQLEMFNRRPPSSVNAARQILEKIQFDGIRKALAETENFKKFYIWNIMLSRQINTMKVQLYYQLREYSKVDELLPKAILFDPQSLAIKLARMYKNNDPKLDKFYKFKCSRLKGENGAFIASVYAWIKIRQEDQEKALDALRAASKTSDNMVLRENIDRLANGKVKHYSNSGFGDTWYMLALEEPKVKNQRQMRAF
jgi:tetratricopeptide (TPR) repeat protein